MSIRRMRIEALIASPPTPKCELILGMLEEASAAYPETLRVDVYLAGEQPGMTPTRGYQSSEKLKRVPCLFVNGKVLAQGEVPERGRLQALIEEELSRGSENWEP